MDDFIALLASAVVGAACDLAADLLDPIGADARADLTDGRIAAFIATGRA